MPQCPTHFSASSLLSMSSSHTLVTLCSWCRLILPWHSIHMFRSEWNGSIRLLNPSSQSSYSSIIFPMFHSFSSFVSISGVTSRFSKGQATILAVVLWSVRTWWRRPRFVPEYHSWRRRHLSAARTLTIQIANEKWFPPPRPMTWEKLEYW